VDRGKKSYRRGKKASVGKIVKGRKRIIREPNATNIISSKTYECGGGVQGKISRKVATKKGYGGIQIGGVTLRDSI